MLFILQVSILSEQIYMYIYIDMETTYHFNPLIVIKVKVIKHRQLKL